MKKPVPSVDHAAVESGRVSSRGRALALPIAVILAFAISVFVAPSAHMKSYVTGGPDLRPSDGRVSSSSMAATDGTVVEVTPMGWSGLQSQSTTFYLHGTGPNDNPPTLLLDATAPTATTARFKDSASINRNNGNPWVAVGTWLAGAAVTSGSVTSLGDLHVWLGLKNSDDQGTNFDVRVEAYKNSTLVTTGETRCITGITRNPASAKEVVVSLASFSALAFNGTSDVLSLKVLTRVGTTPAGASCGGHANAVGLRLYFDAVSRSSRLSATVAFADTTPPMLTVNAPADGLITNASRVAVSGTATDASPVSVSANGINLSLNDGAFVSEVTVPEGVNSIRVVATDSAGNQSEVTRTVTLDLSVPIISNLTPAEGSVIDTATTTVTGQVADATSVSVTVNEVEATVSADGSFTVQGVPVPEGQDVLVIVATDLAGNGSMATIGISGKDRTPPEPPTVFAVTTPTRLPFETIEGRAEPGSRINITGGAQAATAKAMLETGLFIASVNLGAGINTLSITSTDGGGNTSSPISLVITSDPNIAMPPAGQAAQINVATGNAQRGLVASELPRPLISLVTDSQGNPIASVEVRFTVIQGGGQLIGGSDILIATTNSQGYASARYVSGSDPGIQIVRADFTGNTIAPTSFMATALEASSGVTTVSGVVLDQNLRALPNVIVRLASQQTRTGSDGRFKLNNVPAGPHQLLELIGRDQITLPGRWPNITYDMDVLAGVDNNLGRPLFLPRVNAGITMPLNNSNLVTQDTSFELPVVGGEPPITVTARAGTRVTFPPDVTDKRLSVTRIPTNRVPMSLEDGRSTNLYVSVQPSGAIFDPPLEVSFPNVDGLAAGSQVLMMSFDHDAGRYIRVGAGRVSSDAKTVSSEPGSGIRVGAWHGFPAAPPQPETTVLADAGDQNDDLCDCNVWVGAYQGVEMGETDDDTGSPSVLAVAEPQRRRNHRVNVPANQRAVRAEGLCRVCSLKFITQDDGSIPNRGPNSCLMVSNFVTNLSLPAQQGLPADFANNIPAATRDPDSFRIQAGGLPAGAPPQVRLEVLRNGNPTGYNHVFDMVEGAVAGRPVYRTREWVRLVSNAPPNPKPANSQYDDEYDAGRDYQTVLVRLGDTVRGTLVVNGADSASLSQPVARPFREAGSKAIRTVDINFITLAGAMPDPVLTVARLSEDWAQLGIRFNLLPNGPAANPLTNILIVQGRATGNRQLNVDITRPPQAAVTNVRSNVVNGQTDEIIARNLATAITQAGIPASHHPVSASSRVQLGWLVLVNKGHEANFVINNVTVAGVAFTDPSPNLNYAVNIDELEANVLSLNFGDGDASTVDVLAIGRIPIITAQNPNLGGRACGECQAGWRNFAIMREEATDASDELMPFIAGHEMGHVLLNRGNEGHSAASTNLLFEANPAVAIETYDAMKRLYDRPPGVPNELNQNSVLRGGVNFRRSIFKKK